MNKEPEMSSGEQSMVEIVARALAAVDMEEMLRQGMVADKCSPSMAALAAPYAIDELWPNYVVAARAAIGAMKPAILAVLDKRTAMYEAKAERHMARASNLDDDPTRAELATHAAEATAWAEGELAAMIDEALKEYRPTAPQSGNPQALGTPSEPMRKA